MVKFDFYCSTAVNFVYHNAFGAFFFLLCDVHVALGFRQNHGNIRLSWLAPVSGIRIHSQHLGCGAVLEGELPCRAFFRITRAQCAFFSVAKPRVFDSNIEHGSIFGSLIPCVQEKYKREKR